MEFCSVTHTSAVSSSSVTQGGGFSARARIYNDGTAAASGAKVSFYLSTNTTYSTDDRLLGSQTFNVNPHSYSDATWSGTVPSNVAAGTYYVIWVIDPNNTVNEYGYGGAVANVGHHATTVTVSGSTTGQTDVDLRGYGFNATPNTLYAGGTATVDFRVGNYGYQAAGGFKVYLYLSNNSTISTSDRSLGFYQINGLNARTASATVRVNVTLPAASDSFWSGGGTYYIGMVIDPANDVRESSDQNNSSLGNGIDFEGVQISLDSPQGDQQSQVLPNLDDEQSIDSQNQQPQGSPTPDIIGRTAGGQWWVGHITSSGLENQLFGVWSEAAGWRDVVTGDFDGDGDTDVVGRTSGGTWWIGVNTGSGFTNQVFGSWAEAVGWRDVMVVDINGDRRADIIGRTSTGQWWAGQSNGSTMVNRYLGSWNEAANWSDIAIGDFDKDGRDDVIGRTASGQWWLGRITDAGMVNQYLGDWSDTVGWRDVQVGDFNGDGRADVVGRTSTGQWWLGQSNGAALTNYYIGSWSESAGWRDVALVDFDNDGDLDIIGRTAAGDWWLGKNIGGVLTNQLVGSWNEDAGWRKVMFADFNGDGRTDVIGRTSFGQWWLSESDGATMTDRLLGVWNEAADWRDVTLGAFRPQAAPETAAPVASSPGDVMLAAALAQQESGKTQDAAQLADQALANEEYWLSQ